MIIPAYNFLNASNYVLTTVLFVLTADLKWNERKKIKTLIIAV